MKRILALLLSSLLLCVPASGQVPISGLPAATTPLSGTEVVPGVQGATTVKILMSMIRGPAAFRSISSGASDVATSSDSTIAWNSATTSAKTQNLYACTSSVKGYPIYVKDEIGTASTYAIMITPNGSDTIDKAASLTIAFSFQGIQLRCDGAANWIVQ